MDAALEVLKVPLDGPYAKDIRDKICGLGTDALRLLLVPDGAATSHVVQPPPFSTQLLASVKSRLEVLRDITAAVAAVKAAAAAAAAAATAAAAEAAAAEDAAATAAKATGAQVEGAIGDHATGAAAPAEAVEGGSGNVAAAGMGTVPDFTPDRQRKGMLHLNPALPPPSTMFTRSKSFGTKLLAGFSGASLNYAGGPADGGASAGPSLPAGGAAAGAAPPPPQ